MRTIQFHTLSCVKSLKFSSGRAGMFIVTPRFWSMRSRLAKKCSLSLMIGPPMLPPNWICLVSGFLEVLLLGEVISARSGPGSALK